MDPGGGLHAWSRSLTPTSSSTGRSSLCQAPFELYSTDRRRWRNQIASASTAILPSATASVVSTSSSGVARNSCPFDSAKTIASVTVVFRRMPAAAGASQQPDDSICPRPGGGVRRGCPTVSEPISDSSTNGAQVGDRGLGDRDPTRARLGEVSGAPFVRLVEPEG
jgi:hypothetical protein